MLALLFFLCKNGASRIPLVVCIHFRLPFSINIGGFVQFWLESNFFFFFCQHGLCNEHSWWRLRVTCDMVRELDKAGRNQSLEHCTLASFLTLELTKNILIKTASCFQVGSQQYLLCCPWISLSIGCWLNMFMEYIKRKSICWKWQKSSCIRNSEEGVCVL